ncbi:hypothetical protein [Streptomyces sp. MMS24-I29]|uniref:hypothetical protein n=1 Tax=Streptomyces sp. MMS24-I29 TaxID=3351480 RepID=UPI003C7C4998
MGRQKPGKPRRPRKNIPRQYSLQELQPPGNAYTEWIRVQPDMDPSHIKDPAIQGDALDLMHRMAKLGPFYDHNLPMAALLLDTVIDTGHLPVLEGPVTDGTAKLIPIQDIAAARPEFSPDDIRESIHRLHAAAALLVVTDDEHDVTFVRFVVKKPERPGERWGLVGDPDLAASTVCMPTEIWDKLPLDVAAAVCYIRSCNAKLEEPDPAVYGAHEGVNGTAHARELFAAARASGYVDHKGCEACPAGHLCTRTNDE